MSYRALQFPRLGPQLRVRSLSRAAQGPLLRLGLPLHHAILRGGRVIMYARGISTAQYRRVYMSEPSDTERVYQLLPTYLENPDLALSVREFVMGQCSWGISETCPRHNDAEHAAVKRRVGELGLGNETTRVMLDSLDYWRRGPQGERYGPHGRVFAGTITALLLSLCGNINTLYFNSELDPGPLKDYLLASNYGLTSRLALQQLRHVAFRPPRYPDDPRYYEDVNVLDILRCVHRLPCVTSFSMEGVAEGIADNDEPFPPKTSQSLKRVHIGHTEFHPHLLTTILRIPAGLEELFLSFGGLWMVDSPGAQIAPALLEKALRQHKGTLRVLDLDIGSAEISDYDGRPFVDPECDPDYTADRYYQMDLAAGEGPIYAHELEDGHDTLAVGSLRDYKALTHLSVSIELLTTSMLPQGRIGRHESEFRLVDALPANLEYLCLYAYEKGKDEKHDSHVEELMRTKSERLPRLREVVGVDKLVPGVFDKPEGWKDGGYIPEDALWNRPDDGLDGDWVEE